MQKKGILLTLSAAMVLAGIAGFAAAGQTSGRADRPGPGEAVIWYLGHCGYAVRTHDHLLIFDYQEQRDGPASKAKPSRPSLENGWIEAEEIKGLKVRVFVSHSHGDHYNPLIFGWRRTVPDIAYYLGWEESPDPGAIMMAGPRAVLAGDGMEIATINSHHSGVPEVAWLIKIDGLTIYHNGDCQPAEPGPENDFLRTKAAAIDLAFVFPILDEEKYGVQTKDLFRKIPPKAVFPMHVTAGSARYIQFEKDGRSLVPALPIHIPMRMGQRFLFRGGAIASEAR